MVDQRIKGHKGGNGGKWYSPIGITINATSDGVKDLTSLIEEVKAQLNAKGYGNDFNLESPSSFSYALLQFVLDNKDED